jgi:hypothetical protein
MPAVALAALAALALAACTSAHPRPTPSSSPVATPLFTSDAEALKAATDAYAAYQRVSDRIAHGGGTDPELIKPYVTRAQFPKEAKGFLAFSANSRHTSGTSSFDSASLARYDRAGDEVEVFLCQDISSTRVIDPEGTDVTPANRPTRIPMDIVFQQGEHSLLVARSEVWSGKDFC